MAAVPIRMSSIMPIATFCLSRPLTTLISETIFPCRVFAVIDQPHFRAAVRAERERITAERGCDHVATAIRAPVSRDHGLLFDEAHDAGVGLDKICQILKEVAFADYGLERLKAHRIPVDLVKTHDRRIGLAEIAQLCGDLKTPVCLVAHVKSPFRIRDKISARMSPYLQSRCIPSGVRSIRTQSTRNSHLSCAESE